MTQYVRKEKVAEVVTNPTPQKTNEVPKNFTMVKNCPGSLVVNLFIQDFTAPERKIRFSWDQEYQYIPTKWALGVFVTDSALKQLKEGYFTFENLDLLIKLADEEGYYVPESIRENKTPTLKEIKRVLLTNNKKEVQNLMQNASNKVVADLIISAREIYKSLSVDLVTWIEKTYKIGLAPIEIN
jgi:hypothetical protein